MAVALGLLLASGALSWGLGATSSATLVRTTVSTALATRRVGIAQASRSAATSQMRRANASVMIALRRILRAILPESRSQGSAPCSSTRNGRLEVSACCQRRDGRQASRTVRELTAQRGPLSSNCWASKQV